MPITFNCLDKCRLYFWKGRLMSGWAFVRGSSVGEGFCQRGLVTEAAFVRGGFCQRGLLTDIRCKQKHISQYMESTSEQFHMHTFTLYLALFFDENVHVVVQACKYYLRSRQYPRRSWTFYFFYTHIHLTAAPL